MYNTPWIHPGSVDWTDSPNPLKGGGIGPGPTRNPYLFDTFSDPIWVALRSAQNLEPRLWVVPDPIDQVIPAGSTYDMSVPVEPDTWLYGLNTWRAASGDDFYVQITDAITGAIVFSQQAHASNLQSTVANTTSGNGVLYYLSAPRLFVPPSYPIVRIINLAGSAVKCNVVLFCAVEIPAE